MALTVRASIKGMESGSPILSLHKWVGDLPDLQNIGETYRRPGGVGEGTQIVGTAADPVDVPVMFACATQAEALTFKRNLEKLQHTIAWVQDPRGRQFPRVKVEKVPPVKITDTAGAAAYRCETTLTLIVQVNGA